QVAWIIRRAAELAPRWEEVADALCFGEAAGFYLYGSGAGPRPAPSPKAKVLTRALDLLGRLFPVTRDTWLRGLMKRVFAWMDRRPVLASAVGGVPRGVQRPALRG